MDLIFLILSTSVFMSVIILVAMAIFNFWPQAISGKARYIIWVLILIGLIIPFRSIFGNGLFQIETSSTKVPQVVRLPEETTALQTETAPEPAEESRAVSEKKDTGLPPVTTADTVSALWC